MPRRPYQSEEDINLLRMALMEQAANALPGRAPSGIAHNAYLGNIPRTYEQEREGEKGRKNGTNDPHGDASELARSSAKMSRIILTLTHILPF